MRKLELLVGDRPVEKKEGILCAAFPGRPS